MPTVTAWPLQELWGVCYNPVVSWRHTFRKGLAGMKYHEY